MIERGANKHHYLQIAIGLIRAAECEDGHNRNQGFHFLLTLCEDPPRRPRPRQGSWDLVQAAMAAIHRCIGII